MRYKDLLEERSSTREGLLVQIWDMETCGVDAVCGGEKEMKFKRSKCPVCKGKGRHYYIPYQKPGFWRDCTFCEPDPAGKPLDGFRDDSKK